MNAPDCEVLCGLGLPEWGLSCELVLDHGSAHFGASPTWSGYWGRGVVHVERATRPVPPVPVRVSSH